MKNKNVMLLIWKSKIFYEKLTIKLGLPFFSNQEKNISPVS